MLRDIVLVDFSPKTKVPTDDPKLNFLQANLNIDPFDSTVIKITLINGRRL